MKKKLSLVLALSMLASTLVGCSTGPVAVDEDGDGKLEIVCTIYPIYEWVSEIAGDRANVSYLLDNGVDLHNYHPTVRDIVSMKESDLFIYIGGHSDEWSEDVVDRSFNSLNLMSTIEDKLLETEITEGMVSDEDDHDHDHDHSHGYEDYDEHIWMSLINAQLLVEEIAATLSQIDSEYEETYKENAVAYLADLQSLEMRYEKALEEYAGNTIIVADRFPLRYLVDEYDLNYYAAFSGCTSEAEVSFDTITFLTEKVNELELTHIFQLEDGGHKIGTTIMGSNNFVLEINSLQSVALQKNDEDEETQEDTVKEQVTYIKAMQDNLNALIISFGGELIDFSIEDVEEIDEETVVIIDEE